MTTAPMSESAQQIADRVTQNCDGDLRAAVLLLAHLLVIARRGLCSGFHWLGPPPSR